MQGHVGFLVDKTADAFFFLTAWSTMRSPVGSECMERISSCLERAGKGKDKYQRHNDANLLDTGRILNRLFYYVEWLESIIIRAGL